MCGQSPVPSADALGSPGWRPTPSTSRSRLQLSPPGDAWSSRPATTRSTHTPTTTVARSASIATSSDAIARGADHEAAAGDAVRVQHVARRWAVRLDGASLAAHVVLVEHVLGKCTRCDAAPHADLRVTGRQRLAAA